MIINNMNKGFKNLFESLNKKSKYNINSRKINESVKEAEPIDKRSAEEKQKKINSVRNEFNSIKNRVSKLLSSEIEEASVGSDHDPEMGDFLYLTIETEDHAIDINYWIDTDTFDAFTDYNPVYEGSNIKDAIKAIASDKSGIGHLINESKESLGEDLGSDIDKFQEWVDYDMKRYGRISRQTYREIAEAGLKIVKDKYGDYEVIV